MNGIAIALRHSHSVVSIALKQETEVGKNKEGVSKSELTEVWASPEVNGS